MRGNNLCVNRLVLLIIQSFFLINLINNNLFCQSINKTNSEISDNCRTKQFNEFIELFNFSDSSQNNSITLSRENCLKNLIYSTDPRLLNDNKMFSEEYSILIKDFINIVNSKNIKINSRLSDIYVETLCIFNFNHINDKAQIIFKKVQNDNDTEKWLIAAIKCPNDWLVFSEPVNDKKSENHQTISLHSKSNENNFEELKTLFEDKENLIQLFDYKFYLSPLNNIVRNLISGKLKLQKIEKLTYHFLSIPGYSFTVNYLKSNSLDKCWLIDNVKKQNGYILFKNYFSDFE